MWDPNLVADCAPQLSNESRPRATTRHRCCECSDTIEAGDRYVRFKGRYDNEWRSYTTCGACDTLREKVSDGDGYIFGELGDAAAEWGREHPQDPDLTAFEHRSARARSKHHERHEPQR